MSELTLQIDGMSCGHCLNAVNRALSGHPGVTVSSVQIGRAELSFDPARTTAEALAGAVRDAGYEVAVVSGGAE